MKSINWHKISQGMGKLSVNTLSSGASCSVVGTPDRIVITFAGDDADHASIDVPVGFRIVGGHVTASAAVADATLQIRNGTDAITDAVACAVNHTVTPIGSIDDAYSSFEAGDDDLDILCAEDGCAGEVVLEIVPT